MTYQLLYADPPWHYPTMGANGGAALHYDLMTDAELRALPVRDLMDDKAAMFMWATCPRLDFAFEVLKSWGLHYRGVAYVWVKTTKEGVPIGAKGPPPAFVKATTELLLAATTIPKGRVWPLQDLKQKQVVFHSVAKHSAKPEVFRQNIETLAGPEVSKLELFAREAHPGWDVWGNEVDGIEWARD